MSVERVETPRRPRFELGVAALFFALVAVWFTWTPISQLGRETLSPVDALQSSPALAVDPSRQPGNVSQADVSTRLHPAYALDRESFARGELPSWNRFTGFGAPHLAHPDSAPLSPFTWIHCVFALDRAALVEAFSKLFLAGFMAYGFLRALRLVPIACLFGASAYLFSGTIIEHLARPRSAVALALPAGLWLLASLARKLERDFPRGDVSLLRLVSPAHAAGMTAIVAFGCAAGDPQAWAWVALMLVIFAVARGWSVWKRAAGRDGAGVTLAAVSAQLGLIACLAVCVCGIQLVPLIEYLGESSALSERLVDSTAPLARATWSAVVFPWVLGDPAAATSSTLAAFVGPLTLWCALLAPFAVRGRRALTLFIVVAVAWIVIAYDVFGLGAWIQGVRAFRLVSLASGMPVLHIALAACAAFFVHHLFERGPSRSVVAAGATLCVAITALFVARAGASRLVLDTWSALSTPEARSESASHVFVTGAWFMAGAVLLASVWMLRERRLRLAALSGSVVVLLAMNAAPFLRFHTTSPNAFVFQRTPATSDLASRADAHRLVFLGPAPLPPRVAAVFGIESFANADGIGIARVERLRETFFVTDDEGTDVRSATRRGLQMFGIERVLEKDEWIGVDTWTGFAAADPRAEYVTRPLVPDAAVEFDFAYPAERASAVRVEFETGARPLLQNIELEVVDRVTEERLAQRVLAPDFQNPNQAARVFGIVPLPRLADWKSRKLRLVVRSNDGVTASAWSLVARRDWKSVMNRGFWRRDGGREPPVEVRHPDFHGFASRQFGTELRGSIVVDMTWNADSFREDGSIASYRVLDFVEAVPAFRTVSRALAAHDETDALTMVADPAFDPARAVVLEDTTQNAGTEDEGANERVAVLARDQRTVHLETMRARAGWLVTSQPWYPGWRATVNGVEKPILRANYAFGAVALEAGASKIVLEYDPWSIRFGTWLSCGALAGLFGWLLLSRGSGLSRRARSA